MINPHRQRVNIQLPRAIKVFVEQNKTQAQPMRQQVVPNYVPPSVVRINPITQRPLSPVLQEANQNRVKLYNANQTKIRSQPHFTQVTRRKGPVVQFASDKTIQPQTGFIQKLKSVGVGRALVIVGNGPSVATIDLGAIRDLAKVDVCSINKPDDRVWPTQYWAFFDNSQYRRHKDYLSSFEGVLITGSSIETCTKNHLRLKNLGASVFSDDINRGIAIGRSSVFGFLQVAEWMNYEEVFLFGVDMNPKGIGGKLHFYGTNPDVSPEIRAERFKAEADCFMIAANNISDDRRQKIHFCSEHNTWPFVKKFSNMSAAEGLELCFNRWSI